MNEWRLARFQNALSAPNEIEHEGVQASAEAHRGQDAQDDPVKSLVDMHVNPHGKLEIAC